MKRVFIIHGYTGYPEKNWFPWLKSEIDKLDIEVQVPAMPDTNTPKLEAWLEKMYETVGVPDSETFLIGHSLGCPTILRYLESIGEGHKIAGAILVAGFAEPLLRLPELDTFTAGAWDDEKVKSAANKIIIINSDNDEAVPYFNGENVRDRFGAELITVHNAGHINEKSGFDKVPFVLDEFLKLVQ